MEEVIQHCHCKSIDKPIIIFHAQAVVERKSAGPDLMKLKQITNNIYTLRDKIALNTLFGISDLF